MLPFKILRILQNSWEQVKHSFISVLRIRQKSLFIRRGMFFAYSDPTISLSLRVKPWRLFAQVTGY